MRKLFIASVFISLCAADFVALAASPRQTRGGGTASTNNATGSSPVAARAGVKRNVVSSGTQKTAATATTAARAGKKQTVVGTGTVKKARAASSQKVINAGTKVATATANTTVSQECQDAYYGCMDTFCMLDNTSGGRCQCSDRNRELDLVLEEIMKLDEQSLMMATEGVERIQMGESADEIMARAKSAADTVVGSNAGKKQSDTVANKTKARQLDLSAWKNNSLFDEEDDVFTADLPSISTNTFADKTGDALQSSAANLCIKQIPSQCASSSSFLQLAYAQKIKSDCNAYENSLKQQRIASAEKLQTAQKALRDAALDAYQNENKYDFGECVVRFKQCMQTTGECGTDFSGCVADTAILDALYNKKGGNPKGIATKSIPTGLTNVTISSATYDILETKRIMCESVTKQCINANKKGEVWKQVIKDLAPVVYTAEYNAASNNRMNCISTVVNCVQKSCGSEWGDGTDNFDACLSDPNSIENYCKLEYQRCGDGDTSGSVRSYIMAKLAALKVDKCTQDVKACLLSEDRCGPDYTGCIGLDTDSIIDLCSTDSLISCQTTNGKNGSRSAEDVREYIAQIAQGLALNIDNKMATVCQNAVDAAISRVCGDTLLDTGNNDSNAGFSCSAFVISNSSLKDSMRVAYIDRRQDIKQAPTDQSFTLAGSNRKFYNSIEEFVQSEHLSADPDKSLEWSTLLNNGELDSNSIKRIVNLEPIIVGKTDVYGIKYTGDAQDGGFTYVSSSANGNNSFSADNGYTNSVDELLTEIKSQYKQLIDQIKSDTTVDRCINGKSFQGISSKTKSNRTDDDKSTIEGAVRFENLTKSVEKQLAAQAISSAINLYNTELNNAKEKLAAAYTDLADNLSTYISDAELDELSKKACESNNTGMGLGCTHFWPGPCGSQFRHITEAIYDSISNRCTVNITTYYCRRGYTGQDIDYVKSSCAIEKIHEPRYIDYRKKTTE